MKRKPVVKTKLVRIDPRTQIEVNADVPDEVARAKFLKSLERRDSGI